MDDLKVALIQENLIWENSEANIDMFDKHIKNISDTNLIILPEMFNTGFSMEPNKVAQYENGEVTSWMKEKAIENKCALMGSFATKENNQFFNRLIMAYPDTTLKQYNKRHLFRMGGENEKYSSGTKSEVWSYLGWNIKALICYDLRFPVWSRNQNNYDLLIYVANWPASRADIWKTLLKARAIENQCYVIGVNRVGNDGRGIKYNGDSTIIDAKGNIIDSIDNKPGIIQASLNLSEINAFRKQFPVHLDADSFNIIE